MSAPVQPGWFQNSTDPLGLLRWFDGSQWTDQTNAPTQVAETGPNAYPGVPGGGAMMGTPGGAPIAGLGARFVARLVDGLIVLVAYVLVLIGGAISTALGLLLGIAWLVLVFCYQAYFISAKNGQTIGMKMMNIRVVSLEGGYLSFGTAFIRELVLSITGSFFFLGYISVFFDKSHRYRGWHDMAADDVVIKAS